MLDDPDLRSELAFLDGYIFRVILERLEAEGPDASGLYAYYATRIREDRSALSTYDRVLVDYIINHFDKKVRRIVHAGIGVGTLTCALVVAGYATVGMECDRRRFQTASHVRETLGLVWPRETEKYTLIKGEFPTDLVETSWVSPDGVLIFTNCGAGWSDELTAKIISSFQCYGDVILDARLFGRIRDESIERHALLEEIKTRGFDTEPIEGMPPKDYYYHVYRERAAR